MMLCSADGTAEIRELSTVLFRHDCRTTMMAELRLVADACGTSWADCMKVLLVQGEIGAAEGTGWLSGLSRSAAGRASHYRSFVYLTRRHLEDLAATAAETFFGLAACGVILS